MNKKLIDIRSAYGQLILLVFVPITFLAVIGTGLIYNEIMYANKHEQQALAKAILIRYEPVIREQLPQILSEQPSIITTNSDIDENNELQQLNEKQTNQRLQNLLFNVQTKNELQRVAIINSQGEVVASAGFNTLEPWNINPQILIPDNNISNKKKTYTNLHKNIDTEKPTIHIITDINTNIGSAYGVNLGTILVGKHVRNQAQPDNFQTFWLFVDMDNQPLKIAQYRIALALVVTGLLTILLLLLALNIYSRRWIEPIYQIRLFLQGINIHNLQESLSVNSEGELYQLQDDLTSTFRRLNESFQELNEHAEQTEDDLRQAFDEMEMQNISIRDSRDKAISTSEAKSAFLANISHELRTPLNSIDGFINILARQGELNVEQDLYVQTIRKSSAHLLALVNDVLDFSKIEAGKLVLDSHEFNLYDTIYDVVDMLSPLTSEKGLRMGVLIYNDVPLDIIGDALRMKQVLTNMVANAIKFTDMGDVLLKVTLDETRDNFLNLSIQDSGRGVAEQDRDQLFKSFSQVDPSITRQYGGTGLGLIISKQLTQIMGGEIGYFDNSQANISSNGSTFWFSMPAHVDVLEVKNAGDIKLPALYDNTIKSLDKDRTMQVLVWINHAASIQLINASLQPLNVNVSQTNSLASTLDSLKEEGEKWDWVIIDSNNNDTEDNITPLLKQIRLHYQGKLAVYGYQVALDNQILSRYKAHALHEPLDKRKLYQLLDTSVIKNTSNQTEALRWKGYRVLAVDDHLPNLLVLDALLSEQGIEVVTANSGFDAIEIISKQINQPSPQNTLTNDTDESSRDSSRDKIDLIFMDIQMPRMSGHQASQQIRNIDNSEPRIPIIALTAHGMSDERDKLMKSGIDDYVGKPISQPQLLQILQKWLGRNADPNTTYKKHVLSSTSTSFSSQQAPNNDEIENLTAISAMSTLKSISPQNGADYSNINSSETTTLLAIDWQDALDRSAKKPELASKLILMMIDCVDEEQQALEQAWLSSNFEQLVQTAHRILGASRYTGVPELRHASQMFENQCIFIQQNGINSFSEIQLILSPHYQKLTTALTNLANVDLTPWSHLRYHKLEEDDMTWKMI